jgi:hypothetical protein
LRRRRIPEEVIEELDDVARHVSSHRTLEFVVLVFEQHNLLSADARSRVLGSDRAPALNVQAI